MVMLVRERNRRKMKTQMMMVGLKIIIFLFCSVEAPEKMGFELSQFGMTLTKKC